MARVYTADFANVSVAAVQDLFSLQSTSAMVFELHSISLGQITATAVAAGRISFNRFASGFTIGSGGTSLTPAKMVNGDVAATVTARSNDTTQTVAGTGTKTTFFADVFSYLNGYLWLPSPADRPTFAPSQCFVLSLDSVPSTATMSGTITFAELV